MAQVYFFSVITWLTGIEGKSGEELSTIMSAELILSPRDPSVSKMYGEILDRNSPGCNGKCQQRIL